MTNSYTEPTREDTYEAYLRELQNQRQADARLQQDRASGLVPTPVPDVDPMAYKFPTANLDIQSSKPSDYGRALAEDEREQELAAEESSGIGGAIMDTVSFVASPLMAPGAAVIAPFAVGTTDLKTTAQVSWNAFKKALLPTYGESGPEYGKLAARRLGIDDKWGTALEILTDPTIVMGMGAMKVLQSGLRATAKSAKGGKTLLGKNGKPMEVPVKLGVDVAEDAGPWQRGLEEFLGVSRPGVVTADIVGKSLSEEDATKVADDFLKQLNKEEGAGPVSKTEVEGPAAPAREGEEAVSAVKETEVQGPGQGQYTDSAGAKYTREDAINLAKRADLGDRDAMNTITKAIDRSPAAVRYAERMDARDSDAMLRELEAKFGSREGGNDIDFEGNIKIAEELLQESANSNVSTMKGRINLSKSFSDENGNNIVRRMEEIFSEQFDTIASKLTNDDTVLASQRVQLADIMGMKVAEMGPKEAYVLRQSLIVSSDNLQAAARRAIEDNGDELAEVAFDKALAFHTFIQHKAKGASTHAGRLLQSYNITAKATNARIAEINTLLGGTKLC